MLVNLVLELWLWELWLFCCIYFLEFGVCLFLYCFGVLWVFGVIVFFCLVLDFFFDCCLLGFLFEVLFILFLIFLYLICLKIFLYWLWRWVIFVDFVCFIYFKMCVCVFKWVCLWIFFEKDWDIFIDINLLFRDIICYNIWYIISIDYVIMFNML